MYHNRHRNCATKLVHFSSILGICPTNNSRLRQNAGYGGWCQLTGGYYLHTLGCGGRQAGKRDQADEKRSGILLVLECSRFR